jgi:hypothetical protein
MILTATDRYDHIIDAFESMHNWLGVLPIDPTPSQLDRVMMENGDTAVICEEGFNVHFVYESENVILAHYIFNCDSAICTCNFDRTITEKQYRGARSYLSDILPSLMLHQDDTHEITEVFCCVNKPVVIDITREAPKPMSAKEVSKKIIESLSYEDLDDDE